MEEYVNTGAGAIIEKEEHNTEYILIQKRYKDGLFRGNGLIEIPGGRIRKNECIFDCIRREILEETGLEIVSILGEDDSQLIQTDDFKTITFTPFICEQNFGDYYPIVGIIFLCKAKGRLKKQTNESKNIRWISVGQLHKELSEKKELFYPIHISLLKKYLSYKGCNNV